MFVLTQRKTFNVVSSVDLSYVLQVNLALPIGQVCASEV